MSSTATPPVHASRRRVLRIVLGLIVIWAVVAYLLVPRLWAMYFKVDPFSAAVNRVTVTGDGHPGDPVNIALLGTQEQVIHAMTAAGWYPADPITFETSVRIAVDSVFRRPDDSAPVSNLFLFGRKEDLAFEQPVGDSPRQRHHVRFWKWDKQREGCEVWFGSATFDERVGLSHTTGQITHHIGPDVDAERDRIAAELQKSGWSERVEWIDGFHTQLEGRNGGGDPWRTDGRLEIVVLGRGTAAAPGR